jgi:hypothetical protein
MRANRAQEALRCDLTLENAIEVLSTRNRIDRRMERTPWRRKTSW